MVAKGGLGLGGVYDYIVIGSGIAGLYTALLAAKQAQVLVVTKADLEENNTRYAQGGIAAPIGEDDSPELHWHDTLAAGANLCDPEAVRVLTAEAPERIRDLIQMGVSFDTVAGRVALAREGAHSASRVLHAGGDATGWHIEQALALAVRRAGIVLLERHFVTELLVERGRVCGVRLLDESQRTLGEVEARFVVLAAGGAGRLFRFTTNPTVTTGDGVALAYRAGAAVADLEFFQFHPTALALPGAPTFLISEAVRGEGAVLRDQAGRAFMRDYDPRGELASRDIVARAILEEQRQTGGGPVYLDLTHLQAARIRARFPSIYRFCLEHGLDITREPISVAPAAHYMMGGVRTNLWGETTLPGLYACGEVACSGVHGANRLASNSLLEGVVFGHRIVQRTLGADGWCPGGERFDLPASLPTPEELGPPAVRPPTLQALSELMWDKVGLVRDGAGLEAARKQLAAWEQALPPPHDRSEHELANLLLVGRLMAEGALLREESRGAHYRSDFPDPVPQWERHIVFQAGEAAPGIVTGNLAPAGVRGEGD